MLARLVTKSLASNYRITLWTLATLAACSALVVMFTTISLDVTAKMQHTLRQMGANALVYPQQRTAQRSSEDDVTAEWSRVKQITRRSGAELAVLRLRVAVVEGQPVAVVAGQAEKLANMTPYWAVTGSRPKQRGECLIGRKVAETFDLKTGSTVDLTYAGFDEATSWKVVGLLESGDEDEQRLFVTGHPTEVIRSGKRPELVYGLASVSGGEKAIRQMAGRLQQAGVRVEPLRQILHGEEVILQKITLLAGLALVVVVVLSALGVTAAMLARVVERRQELAILQALGATRKAVGVFLLSETAALAGAASLLGFALGTVLAQVTVRNVFDVSVSPHWAAFLAGLAATLLVAVISGVLAARRSLKTLPAMALRGE